MKRIVLFVTLACAATPAFAHKVRVDFDQGTKFGGYKTYRLVQSPGAFSPDPTFPNQLLQQRICGFIEEALAAKGLKRTTKGEDLQVSYGIKVIAQPTYTTFSDGWGSSWDWDRNWGSGWGPGWGGGIATTTVQVTYQGILVVDVVDTHQQKVVFEGTSEQAVSSKPEKNTRKLAKAVNEVFVRYPPKP
jgi:hypothetical protein